MNLKKKINKKNIKALKVTVSELMQKKAQLQVQIQNVKDSIQDIKEKKEVILKKINELDPKTPVNTNRIWKMVEEKKVKNKR